MFTVKRVYEGAEPGDGFRILVDRLWPRGVSKEKAALDLWLKDIAPSDALRKWFGHDPDKWTEFRKKYLDELHHNQAAVDELRQATKGKKKVTLLFGTKDEKHNEAVVLREYLTG